MITAHIWKKSATSP